MNTDTGHLRVLKDDESLPSVEEARAAIEAGRPLPPEVEVPASYGSLLSPELRLALAFGGTRPGKDRKAANPRPKSARQRRYERAEHRKAMQAKRSKA